MSYSSRYAVYYAPEINSELANFGANWLGWDAQTSQSVPHLIYDDLPVSDITATPRKYGFHGTLKPPFRLAYGKTVADLNEAVAELAAYQTAFEIENISLRILDGFLAITPTQNSTEISALADTCVRDLDWLRAPLGAEDLARRRAAKLTPRQEKYLTEWGYPYVFEDFRFHLTLTGKLPEKLASVVQGRLIHRLAKPLSCPLAIREICLFRENSDGRFYIFKRYPLASFPARLPENLNRNLPVAHYSE